MKKVLVTGANGFVGSHIVDRLLKEGYEVFASSRTGDQSSFNSNKNYRFIQVNFADPYSLHDAFEFVQPDIVVHSGAMSKPDICEQQQADAFDTNVYGTVQLLLNAEACRAFFVHLSTDFVFNGEKGMYLETDSPDPVNYYGKTKLQAEEAVAEYQHGWATVRTAFVYGKPIVGRDSFVTMMEKKLRNGTPYRVVNDQERSPTYAPDLAEGIHRIIEKQATGLYHISGKDVLTPYRIAIEVADRLGITRHQLTQANQSDFVEVARRPLKTALSIEKARKDLGYEPVAFKVGLQKTLAEENI